MKRLGTAIALILVLTTSAGAGPSGPPGPVGPVRFDQRNVPPPPPDKLARIREAVNREPVLKIENGQLRIYVEVIGKWPSFVEMNKGYDWQNGPTGYGNPMSHQDFLSMVTPKDMYGSSGIQAGEILTMAAVNYVGQAAIGKAIKSISKSRSRKELADIHAQIDRELAALKGGK